MSKVTIFIIALLMAITFSKIQRNLGIKEYLKKHTKNI
jgi:hypothetical protein